VVKIAKRGGLRCAICRCGEILHRRVALRGGLAAGVLFQLELAADPEGKGATYFATLKRGEEVLAKNQANAKLAD
jgi:hypothetical protein